MSKSYKSSDTGTVVLAGCLMFLLVIALWLGIVALGALVLMWAWNLVLPSLLGWPVLTYPMALGLAILLSVIGNLFRGGSSK